MSSNIKLSAFAITNTGLLRTNNEDNFYFNGRYMNELERDQPMEFHISERESDYLFAVCDGMGGEAKGELASLITVKAMNSLKEKLTGDIGILDIDRKRKHINEFVKAVNEELCNIMKQQQSRMGTTLSGIFINNNKASIFHMGDSRVYLYRDKQLKQLTSDHTEAQRLVRIGAISQEQAKQHRTRNQLTRHLGIFPEEGAIEADIYEEIDITEGDIFLISSDGLTDMLEDSEIEAILENNKEGTDIHNKLMYEALTKGGHDNTTAIVIRIDDIVKHELRSTRRKRHTKSNFKSFLGIFAAIALAGILAVFSLKMIMGLNKPKTEIPASNNNAVINTPTPTQEPDAAVTAEPEEAQTVEEDNNVEEDNTVEENNDTAAISDTEQMEEENSAAAVDIPKQYTIKKGDNLYQISKKYYGGKNAVPHILALNGISEPNKIFVGQTILLPSMEDLEKAISQPENKPAESTAIPEFYVISKGDNLYKISERFYGSRDMVGAIMELNNIEDANKIFLGQKLRLPAKN